MEKQNKKDIVDQIVEQLKSVEDLPYKEGAWEHFQQKHSVSPFKRNRTYYWAASAAAILLIGTFAVQQFTKDPTLNSNENLVVQQEGSSNKSTDSKSSGNASDVPELNTPNLESSQRIPKVIAYSENPTSGHIPLSAFGASEANHVAIQMEGVNVLYHPSGKGIQTAGQLANKNYQIGSITLSDADRADLYAINDNNNSDNNSLVFGNQVLASNAQKGQQPDLKSRKFNFKEKFDLGVFLSPNSTNEKFNFGGGLLLAYNVTKNLSIRTGLAYNRYEVGSMRDPVANQDIPITASRDAIEKYSANSLVQPNINNALILPNINAISGAVQAIEVPIDIKYKSKEGFYASTGLTYAAVTNQERYAHYIENNNTEVFANGRPTDQKGMEVAVKQVSKAIKTEDQNVNTNGFGGFMNISVGKELRMNKGFSISVEPYVKLPVGNFKTADMNYTNGGLRIITNF